MTVLVSGVEWLLVAGVLAVGAVVQGMIGFGMVVLALPVLLLIEPELVPSGIILGVVVLPVTMAVRHREGVVWSEVGWILLGRVPGLVVAVLALRVLDREALTVAAAGSVLVIVVASLTRWEVARTPGTLVVAGVASSVMGTIAAIGGPAAAIVYQRSEGTELRGTLGVLNATGAVMAAVTLVVAGEVDAVDARTGLSLIPAILAGLAAARWFIPLADRRLRPMVLAVSGFASVVVLIRVLF